MDSDSYDKTLPFTPRSECSTCLRKYSSTYFATCGHFFCSGCLNGILDDGEGFCPIDDEKFLERQLAIFCCENMEVTCPACNSTCRLSEMQSHFENCEWNSRFQNYNVDSSMASLPRNLNDSLELYSAGKLKCRQRQNIVEDEQKEDDAELEKIFKDVARQIQLIEDKIVILNDDVKDLSSLLWILGLKREKSNLWESVIMMLFKIKNYFTNNSEPIAQVRSSDPEQRIQKYLEKKIGQLEEKLADQILENQKFSEKRAREIINSFANTKKQSEELMVFKTNHSKQLMELQEELNNLKSSIKITEDQSILSTPRAEKKQSKSSISTSPKHLENSNIVTHKKVFIWKLQNFSKLRTDAISGICKVLRSEPFFSHEFGYKMCLELHPNGFNCAEGTHMSMYLDILQGPVDDILQWPIKYSATLMMLDQTGKNIHICKPLKSSGAWSGMLNKPKTERNRGWGYQKFAVIKVAEGPEYLVNDTIYFKVVVDVLISTRFR